MTKHAFTALAALAVGIALTPSIAQAAIASGYVCSAAFDPRSGSYGSYGNVEFTIHSSPDCAGTYLGNYVLLTTGADSTLHGLRYSSSQITLMLDQLLRSAGEAGRVTFGYTGGGSGYGASAITFKR